MKKSKQNRNAGFTLVEALVAIVLIAVLVVGGGAALYHTGTSIKIQANKRKALELANQRMEIARANNYYDIAPKVNGSPIYDVDNRFYLTANNTVPQLLVLRDGQISENVTLGGHTYKMLTKVIRHSEGTVFAPECLEVTVTVEYRADTSETVECSTLILHPDVTSED